MSEHKPKTSINFHCGHCNWAFAAEPGRIEDAPELEYHPFRYFADCELCGHESHQAAWERNLFKAWANATGPKTRDGKAMVAKNLEGHPTPEEALRTRFNAMKHGVFARTATYFPAKPGQYAACQDCELRETICPSQTACLKKTELFMKHHIAFESRDPAMLMEMHSDRQSAVAALIDDMICNIMRDGGTAIRSPEWYYDKDGGFHLASYVDENTGKTVTLTKTEAHPLLKPLMDFLNKNAMTLADLEMTPKAKDEQEALEGFIDAQEKNADQTGSLEYQKRISGQLDELRSLIQTSREKTRRDPVLIEHGREDDT